MNWIVQLVAFSSRRWKQVLGKFIDKSYTEVGSWNMDWDHSFTETVLTGRIGYNRASVEGRWDGPTKRLSPMATKASAERAPWGASDQTPWLVKKETVPGFLEAEWYFEFRMRWVSPTFPIPPETLRWIHIKVLRKTQMQRKKQNDDPYIRSLHKAGDPASGVVSENTGQP